LEGKYYKRCAFHPKYGGNPEVIGCKSKFNPSMLPVNEDRKEEFDDADGYVEKCLRGNNDKVTYMYQIVPNRKQAAIKELCN
ncbi:hypothetical protein PMAYCL1PPCAC_14173, partial [Pristionchus mayeri]